LDWTIEKIEKCLGKTVVDATAAAEKLRRVGDLFTKPRSPSRDRMIKRLWAEAHAALPKKTIAL
jgi:hypothetical protein